MNILGTRPTILSEKLPKPPSKQFQGIPIQMTLKTPTKTIQLFQILHRVI